MKAILAAGACVLALSIAGPALLAHHSAAGIDRSQTVELEGTVREFRWTNPHSWMQVDVTDENGEVVTWTLEMTAPSFLIRAGWTSKTVEPGDVVQFVARPLRNGDPGGLFVSVTVEGETLTERAQR